MTPTLRPVAAVSRATAYATVAIGAVLMLAPFYFMFVFATHSRSDIFSLPPPLWFGDALMTNLRLLQDVVPLFWRNFGTSVYVALMATALSLFFCSLAGFAFAMYEFRFKRAAFAMVMATLLLPPFLGMIPTFMIMDAFGWLDRPIALYLPGAAGAFGIYLMRQYIASAIPRELVEAARMDGCGEFRIYWNIVLPLTTPALGTLGLISFIASWNSFLGPLVVMRSMEAYTLPLALRSMQSPVNTEWGAVMAGSALAVLPLLLLFMLSSRRLIAGLTAGAVKS
jgi:multiple sugar transport system permease protein